MAQAARMSDEGSGTAPEVLIERELIAKSPPNEGGFSIPKTIETLFGLPSLTTRDAQAHDLLDALDFAQPPRPPLVLQTRTCP